MQTVVVIGEILVEIMADTAGTGFLTPMPLTGPFPSGAPAIFCDQVAKLGQPCGLVSAVGADDFGRINLDRLQADGVDISAIAVDPTRPTGSAFVRYRSDGGRDFIFNIVHSACGVLAPSTAADALIARAGHLHVMGSSLASASVAALTLDAARRVKSAGGTVSFDPNLRREMLGQPGLRDAMLQVLALTDLFLPSGDELTLLTEATSDDAALQELLARGLRAVVHKRGSGGARYHDGTTSVSVAGFPVREIDPTGAGDSFGAAFVTFWLRGMDPAAALRRAAAAGALAVCKRGPMEGTSDSATLDDFLQKQTGA